MVVLVEQKHMSQSEALKWMGEVSVYLIKQDPLKFFSTVASDVYEGVTTLPTFIYDNSYFKESAQQFEKEQLRYILTSKPRNLRADSVLMGKKLVLYSIIVTKKICYLLNQHRLFFLLALMLGTLSGFFVFQRLEYLFILAVVLFHMIVPVIFANVLARYRYPNIPFLYMILFSTFYLVIVRYRYLRNIVLNILNHFQKNRLLRER